MKNSTIKKISLVQTWIWILLFIPVSALFFMMGVSSLMLFDSAVPSGLNSALIIAGCALFWGTPIMIIVSIVASFYLRKKGEFMQSVVIQTLPIAAIFLALLSIAASLR